jgi:uncharacterized protein YdhG (YjbR/CyaY superfamily)
MAKGAARVTTYVGWLPVRDGATALRLPLVPLLATREGAAGNISSLADQSSSWQPQFMESIDDALAGLPQPEHDALQRVIDIARRVAPHAIDGASYGVPALKVAGRPLIGVSASAHHLSIFPFSPAAIDVVRTELDGFSVSKGTIRFTAERPVPEALIERHVAARLAEIT